MIHFGKKIFCFLGEFRVDVHFSVPLVFGELLWREYLVGEGPYVRFLVAK